MSEQASQRAAEVLGLCEREGFALSGAAPLLPSEHGQELRDWLAAGKHGEMAWLAATVEERLDPRRLLPGARSVVMVADFYAGRGEPEETPEPGVGRIARYARGRDYHDVLKRRVQRVCDAVRERYPGAATRAFCDTAPVMERELAAACGLGWIGKHTLLIHPTHGSWMVLGGFLTTLALAPPVGAAREPDHCGSCARCIDACPTGAITPYGVDASRCISYLTIEHESPIEPELAGRLGGWLVGCDVCQEVCPHNSVRSGASDGGFAVRDEYAPRRRGFDLLGALGWDEATRRARFATSAMKRVSLEQVKRNAILLLGQSLQGRGSTHAAGGGPGAGPRALGEEAVMATLREIAWDATVSEGVRRCAGDELRRRAAT